MQTVSRFFLKCCTTAFVGMCLLTITAIGQSASNCFEIKYLDFFELDNTDTLKWPAKELDQLLTTDFANEGRSRDKKTNFFIPMIVSQLKGFYPACTTNSDTSTFRKLTQLYCKIRQQDFTSLSSKSIAMQLEDIREDFYVQVKNDSLLPYMSPTFDDGPFYGALSKYIPGYTKGQSYKTEFGTLFITRHAGKIFLTVLDKQDKHLWTRIMTGNNNSYLTDLSFTGKDVLKTSLGYQLNMSSAGEALSLYLKPGGDFRYYFHSW